MLRNDLSSARNVNPTYETLQMSTQMSQFSKNVQSENQSVYIAEVNENNLLDRPTFGPPNFFHQRLRNILDETNLLYIGLIE